MADEKILGSGDQAWAVALEFMKPVGSSPTFFTRYISALMRNKEENLSDSKIGLSPGSIDALKWLMLSKTLRSIIYFAGVTFKAEQLPVETFDTPKSLALLFGPEELASLMGVSFLYKRIKAASSEEEWKRSRRKMLKAMDIGGQLGQHTTGVGFARGVLAGAIPQLARLVLALNKPEEYAHYRAHIRKENLFQDPKLAIQMIGTTEAHVGTFLLNSMGFGRNESQAYFDGVTSANSGTRPRGKAPAAYRVCSEWVESLLMTGQAPEVDAGDDLEMTDEAVDKLLPKIFQILEDDESLGWVEKNYSHIEALRAANRPKAETEIKEVDDIFLQESESVDDADAAALMELNELLDTTPAEQA